MANLAGHNRDSRPLSRVQVEREIERLLRLDDEEASELLLIRHAEPATRSANGTPLEDPLLSCTGLMQAQYLAERYSSSWIETIYTAPERRAFLTARMLAEATERPVEVLEDLRNIKFDGTEARSVSYSDPAAMPARWDLLPGFEPAKTFRLRAILAIEAAIAAHPGRRIAVVTHTSVINAYLSMLWQVPSDIFFAPDHASVSVVRTWNDLQAVRCTNDTSHLEGVIASR